MPDAKEEPDAGLVVHIIDDDAAVRESLEALLLVAGFDVHAYGSAEEFLEHGPVPQGCLLLDLNMPGMSGFELLDRLGERGSRVPAVILTARRDDGLHELALARGARRFLNKPVKESDLLSAIAEAVAESAGETRHRGSPL